MSLRVLHVLDHSIPLHSGYTFRTLSILREQRRLGWDTHHLTSPKHTAPSASEETVDGWHFHLRRPWPDTRPVTLVDTGENTLTGGRLRRVREHLGSDEPFCFTYGDGVADMEIVLDGLVGQTLTGASFLL